MKISPRPLKNMKNDTEINIILISVTSWFLHTLSHQILVFQAPHDQIHPRKSLKKNLVKNMEKITSVAPKYQKSSQNGVPKST